MRWQAEPLAQHLHHCAEGVRFGRLAEVALSPVLRPPSSIPCPARPEQPRPNPPHGGTHAHDLCMRVVGQDPMEVGDLCRLDAYGDPAPPERCDAMCEV